MEAAEAEAVAVAEDEEESVTKKDKEEGQWQRDDPPGRKANGGAGHFRVNKACKWSEEKRSSKLNPAN